MGKFTQVYHDPSILPKLRPSKNPLALVKGEWETLSNFRTTEQTLRARFGTTNLGSIVTSVSFRGAIVAPFYGVETFFVAGKVSDKVRVYKSTDGATWTEITKQFNGSSDDTTIGPYGLTRMDDDGMVQFAVVQDRDIKVVTYPNGSYQQDVLLIFNQSNETRAYGRFYGGNADRSTYPTIDTSYTAIIQEVTPPTAVQKVAVIARPFTVASGFPIRDASSMDFTNSGANLVLSENGGSTNNFSILTVGTSTAAGDSARIRYTASTRQLLAGTQLHIAVDTTWTDFLAHFTIQVGISGGSYVTIWAPGSPDGTVVETSLGGNNILYSFTTEHIISTTGYDEVKLTYVGGPPSASKTVNIWMITPGVPAEYSNPGNTLWAVSWYNAGTHTESRGVVYTINYPEAIQTPGGNEVPDAYTGVSIPATTGIQFAYWLPIPNPTADQRDVGVEAARIYRKRPDDGDYFLLEHYELATYTEPDSDPGPGVTLVPTWVFTNSTSASEIRRAYGLSRDALSQTTYPDEFHVHIPKARAGLATSDRLFVGAKVQGKPGLMISAQDQCFRFREINNYVDGALVEDSPIALNLQGDIINGFAQVSGAAIGTLPSDNIGISTVYAFGERYVYMTGGKLSSQLIQLSNLGLPGTVSPGSIAVNRNRVFYLDREMQVQMIRGGQGTTLSRQKVDTVLRNITNAKKRYVWGEYYNERYYLLYDPGAGTTTAPTDNNALIWSEEIGDWESFDKTPRACEAWVSWHDVTTDTVKLVAFMQIVGASVTLRANTYDLDDLDDLGSDITVSGEAFDMHNDQWDVFTIDRISVVADKAAGKSITWTLPYKKSGSRTSTTSLSGSDSYVRKFDTNQVNTDPARGGASQLTFSASVPGGWRLYNITAEVETRAEPADRGDA